MIPAICASQTKPKNFQNSLPTLFLQELVALAMHRLDPRAAVGQRPQLATDAADVYVNTPVMSCEWTAQSMFRKIGLADRAAGVSQQQLQYAELRAGQHERLAHPFRASLLRPHGQGAARE
jgi:hypothetical protein